MREYNISTLFTGQQQNTNYRKSKINLQINREKLKSSKKSEEKVRNVIYPTIVSLLKYLNILHKQPPGTLYLKSNIII